MHLDNSHELRYESLQMEYNFGSGLDAMLIESRPLDNFTFQPIVNEGNQLERQGLEDSSGGNAVCQEIVKL